MPASVAPLTYAVVGLAYSAPPRANAEAPRGPERSERFGPCSLAGKGQPVRIEWKSERQGVARWPADFKFLGEGGLARSPIPGTLAPSPSSTPPVADIFGIARSAASRAPVVTGWGESKGTRTPGRTPGTRKLARG
jgi:hypothetical protein